MRSLAECVRGAAEALDGEFSFATIVVDRVTLGSYPVAVLAHRATEVAEELALKRDRLRQPASA